MSHDVLGVVQHSVAAMPDSPTKVDLFRRCWCSAVTQRASLWLITKLLSHCFSRFVAGGWCVSVWLLRAASVPADSSERREVPGFRTSYQRHMAGLGSTCVSD